METIRKQNLIDFIGIGNGRSGSTWISECLAQHPDVMFSSEKSRKELKFFCVASNWSNYEKGIGWYLKQFPPYQEGKVRGEFCPSYLHDKKSHVKIKEHFPDVKIIAVLRNPIDWIYAFYQWCRTAVYYGPTPESFEEALKLSQFGNSLPFPRKTFILLFLTISKTIRRKWRWTYFPFSVSGKILRQPS